VRATPWLSVADKKTCIVFRLVRFIPLVPFIPLPGLAFRCRGVWGWLYHRFSSAPCNDSDFFLSWPLGKRPAPEPAEGFFNRLKRTKTVKNAPSDTGKSAIYESLQQQTSEKILDDRPHPDLDIPPIPLLYHGFGHFLDIMDARDDVPGLADVDVPELRNAVDDLAREMTGYFSKEDDRRDAALPCLNRIFLARRGINIPPLSAAAIGSVITDGHNTATHGAGTMAVEFKNWSTGVSSLPQIEVVCYVARLMAMKMDHEVLRQLYERWRVPCVGLTIVGE